ncbi:MAG: choice-of-anchor B family protein [Bacteroidetes bacterium]|nr:choice-of-anchor B family protein [Bacteroidota bacterium]
MIKITFLFLFFISTILLGQTNIELIGSLNQYPAVGYNDIWGYVDGQGIEYALLGTRGGTSIIRLDDPANPQEVAFIPGPQSIARDIKVHGQYAYVVTEGTGTGQGLQIIDLSNLPNSVTLVNTIDTWFSSAHNIYIDNGFAYVIGTDQPGGGMHILDLSVPENPTHPAYYSGSGYVHDVYVWDDTVVVCAGPSSEYHLVNVSNKTNPQFISASSPISGIYAHSGWMTEDKRYFIAAEESNVRDLIVYDLQDRSTWDVVVPSWQMSGNSPIHNIFVLGNYAHISYYKDGYVVLDISDPTAPTIAGQYDTFPGSGGTYDGAWGCYPYLPSGHIIISDMSTGLYILSFDSGIPVELTSFTARIDERNIILNWATATETNNLGFEVQRRSDDDYRTIGFVDGHGTTTEIQNYSFADINPETGLYHYRLKQIDFDGTIEFSQEIEVEFFNPSKFELKQNYPNPFNPSTNISFSIPEPGLVTLKVYSILGEEVAELINEFKEAGIYEINFSAANLTTGIYIAKLSTGNNIQTIKMSLLK